jgi:HK97 family phage portal protein
MNNKRIPLRQRIALAIAGVSTKDFIPALTPFGDDVLGGVGRTENYATKQAQVSANVGWSYAANRAIVENVAAVELKLFLKKPDGDREEIFDHPVLDLLNKPNLAHTGEQLRQLHHTYMNFTGEGYILMTKGTGPFTPKAGQLPDALQVLESNLVDFKLGTIYSKSIVKFHNERYPITSVIRDINPNPMSPYSGESVIAAAAATIDLDARMKEWNRNLIANGAKPSLIFSTDTEMSDDAYNRWKQQFKDENTGTGNAGKPMLIENGDAKPYMLSPQDLDFLASREFSRDEILAMWRVPGAVLGATSDFNRANMDAAFYIHTINNVVPRIRQFVKQLNQTFIQPYDATLELDFENPVPEDKVAKLADAIGGVNKWWTIDEVRDMYGMDPMADGLGEQLYVPSLTIPLNKAGTVAPPRPTQNPEDPNGDGDDDLTEDIDIEKALVGVKKKT